MIRILKSPLLAMAVVGSTYYGLLAYAFLLWIES